MTFKGTLCCSVAAFVMTLNGKAYAQQKFFDLQSAEAVKSIPEFVQQAGIQIVAPGDGLRGVSLPRLKGTYDVREALNLLLLNTNLKVVSDNGDVVILRSAVQKKTENVDVIRVAAAGAPGQSAAAAAQPAAATESAVEEVVVTGSRIVREGYEAPTPMTVVGTETLETNADSSLLNLLSTMPAITGARTTTSSAVQLGQSQVGIQAMNLRGLGQNRVLVLLDGQRTVGANYANFVDVGSFPEQLVSRVDVVTGGASAVYGSDAVTGVVNFVLDRQFVGVKGEVSAGITNYGDRKTYKIDLSAGFGFADNRGHVLISGEHQFSGGIKGDGGRLDLREGWLQLPNPSYTATNGQPQQLFLPQGALSAAAPGGLIVAGPLKGTAFGPGGVPYKFNYGPIVGPTFMQGGDWAINNRERQLSDLDPVQATDSLFLRAGYDVTENINVYAQWMFSHNNTHSIAFPLWLPGTATAYTIQRDNAYLPASVRAAMVAANVTSFPFGTWNEDMPPVYNYGDRATNRVSAGVDGRFDVGTTTWKWNAHYSYGSSHLSLKNNVAKSARYRQAIDAVVNPATGQIVCRITLTDPTSRCKPWNAMGVGVNPQGANANAWMVGDDGFGWNRGLIEQTTMAATINGEPFLLWAGPVSVAASFEHRIDEINAPADALGSAGAGPTGNYAPLFGKQSVTEGALEMIVPLAKDESWARAWDFSTAVRFTGYQLAGYVTTYKFGTTFTPIDDLKFRITRSRDIRAPTLQDLFASPQVTQATGFLDRFLNNQPTQATALLANAGNSGLVPEKGDTTGVGVVLAPSFLSGFTASVDYWNVAIKDAIRPITGQQIIDSCYSGRIAALCGNIIRDSTGQISRINSYSINLAVQDAKGIDVEASYRMAISDVVADWRGGLSLHGLMTFYLRNYADTKFTTPTDSVGQNTGDATPNWKFSVTASYALDPVTVSFTGRGFSSGTINNTWIACTSGCPAATVDHPTANTNYVPGRFYLDASVNYKLDVGEASSADLFFSVKNVFNSKVAPVPALYFFNIPFQATLYDPFGVVYRAGVRFKI